MLVHGGMAQNVGPILEMVTEKYLLRSRGRVGRRGSEAMRHPRRDPGGAARPATSGASARRPRGTSSARSRRSSPGRRNHYTETLIERVRAAVRRRLLGLLDARRHVGRRHGLHLRAPRRKPRRRTYLAGHRWPRPSASWQHALPFAMEPVVYDFADQRARHVRGAAREASEAMMPAGYYALRGPRPAAGGPRPARAARDGRSSTGSAQPAATGRSCCGMVADACSTGCCRAPRSRRRGAAQPRARCWTRTASTASSTSRSAPTCGAAGSAWRRTACRRARRSRMSAPTTWSTRRTG